ncbi:universal stress protein [Natrinema halophilum]|uniref:Universal stress protein n=1 Tax=Natrinema halophilum TaxID=1699371 RepID=A0A7D5H4Y3_9EURY|nr:universal stress protein [Natrinema halophilum]QLG50911.1 universal stress protein [Natrinema halophilum]
MDAVADRRPDSRISRVVGDFVALRNRGFDAEHILVPTAGGPSSDLSAELARDFQNVFGSEITLLNVSDDEAAGTEFLEEWATENGLDDATLRVETGSVNTAIAEAAEDCSMVILGATGRGLLSRMLRGSSVVDVVDQVDCSVIMAERPSRRSLRERLFGVQK